MWKAFLKIAPYGVAFVLLIALDLEPSSAAAAECRAGFDLGSTEVRVGSNDNHEGKADRFEYLDHVKKNGVDEALFHQTVKDIKTALQDAQMPPDCALVAGGFSAWRAALDAGEADKLSKMLDRLHQENIHNGRGVPLYVIPIDVEAIYAHTAAKHALGEDLTTPFIWDIGGGSMQFGSEDKAWGAALGQDAWRALFCGKIEDSSDPKCPPNPVGKDAKRRTGELLAADVGKARKKLGESGIEVTAVSPPFVFLIHPILNCVVEGPVDDGGFSRDRLSKAIALLAEKSDGKIREVVGANGTEPCVELAKSPYIDSSVTSMLLVDTFMEGLSIERVEVANAKINNVQGIIEDDRSFAWAKDYGCYLDRLREKGVTAYDEAKPAECP
jgi:hypothetical protein